MKPRSKLRSAIISFLSSLVLPQFHKIPPQTLKSPLSHINLVSEPNFLIKKKREKKRNQKKNLLFCEQYFTFVLTVILLFIGTVHAKHNHIPVSVSGTFGIWFKFCLKRWMHEWVTEPLWTFHDSWITDLTYTSPCLMSLLFL